MKVDKAVCTNDTLEDLNRAIRYEAVFTTLVENKILAIKRDCEERKKAKRQKRKSFGKILFGKRIFGRTRSPDEIVSTDANEPNGKNPVATDRTKINDVEINDQESIKSVVLQRKLIETLSSVSSGRKVILATHQMDDDLQQQDEESTASNGDGSPPENSIGTNRNFIVEVLTHQDSHSYDDDPDDNTKNGIKGDNISLAANTLEAVLTADVSSLASVPIEDNTSAVADGSLTSIKDSSESLSFPSSRCTVSFAAPPSATTFSYEKERSRLRVLEAKSISAQCSPIMPIRSHQHCPGDSRPLTSSLKAAQTQTYGKLLLGQVSYKNPVNSSSRSYDALRLISRQNTSEDSANLTLSTLLNENACLTNNRPAATADTRKKSKSASLLVVTDNRETQKAIANRFDSRSLCSSIGKDNKWSSTGPQQISSMNPLRGLISSFNQLTTAIPSSCMPVITTTAVIDRTNASSTTSRLTSIKKIALDSGSREGSPNRGKEHKHKFDTIKLQRMASTSTGSSIGPSGCCSKLTSNSKDKDKQKIAAVPVLTNFENSQTGSDDEYRKRKRKYKRYHRCSDPVLVYPASGGLQHCILSMPPNQPIQFHYNEDFVYDMTLQVETDQNGDLQAIVPSHRRHKHRHHRHKKRNRHKKPKILVHDLDTQSVKVIDPDDLPQRARWTIIATACLLLVMCLMLVGITLRMAPIIDDMGK